MPLKIYDHGYTLDSYTIFICESVRFVHISTHSIHTCLCPQSVECMWSLVLLNQKGILHHKPHTAYYNVHMRSDFTQNQESINRLMPKHIYEYRNVLSNEYISRRYAYRLLYPSPRSHPCGFETTTFFVQHRTFCVAQLSILQLYIEQSLCINSNYRCICYTQSFNAAETPLTFDDAQCDLDENGIICSAH